MWTARYFPGLGLTVERLDDMLPEETAVLRRQGMELLRAEAKEREAHTRAIMRASSGVRIA